MAVANQSLAVEDGTGTGAGGQEYTQDGSVDLRGNPVLRSKRGGWTACTFIVVYELFERMAYYGIAANLFIYLTDKMHQGTVEASNNVTNWSGTVFLTPLLGAYVADAYLGRYWTFVVGSAIYLMLTYEHREKEVSNMYYGGGWNRQQIRWPRSPKSCKRTARNIQVKS